MIDHIISTPTGRRILTSVGRGFATMRPAFAPDNPGAASERLHVNRAHDDVSAAIDGVFVNPRHLWAILVGLTKRRKAPISASEAAALLFYEPLRPDVHKILIELMATYDAVDPWWKAMTTHGRYDSTTATIHCNP